MKTSIKIIASIAIVALIGFAGYSYGVKKATSPVGGVPINEFSTGTNSAVSVTTSTTAIATSNVGRQYLIIVNDGAYPVYLGLGASAVASTGIRLNANGGSYEINQDNLFVGAINGIAVGGTSVVTVFEK